MFLVEDLIENNSLNLLVSPSFTGKTYVAIDLCRSIANNKTFLDKTVDNGGVIFIDNEMKPKHFYKRLNKIGFQDANESFIYYNRMFPDVTDSNEKQQFINKIKYIKDFNDTKLIIIDSLSSSTSGLEENSNKDMREFMNFLNEISEICSVLLIHHTSKYNNPKNLNREDIRGASCIFGYCDNVFVIDSFEDTRTLKALKARNQDKLPNPIPFSFVSNENCLSLLCTDIKVKGQKPSKSDVLELFKDNCNQKELMSHFRENGLVFSTSWMISFLTTIPEIKTTKGANRSIIYHKEN
jgi:RecA-family ATPase